MQRSWSLSSHREAGEPPGARAAPSEWIRAFRGQRSTQDPGWWWGQHDVPATGDRTGSCRTLSPEEHRGRLDGRAEDAATTAMLLPPSTSALGGSAVSQQHNGQEPVVRHPLDKQGERPQPTLLEWQWTAAERQCAEARAGHEHGQGLPGSRGDAQVSGPRVVAGDGA